MDSSIRRLREMSGLSQYETAREAGLDRTRLSLVENGHVRLTEDEKSRLARVLTLAIRDRLAELKSVTSEALV
jgi:transcriptional regulator with XRE-family HTH domain